jgi:hypothetical protein
MSELDDAMKAMGLKPAEVELINCDVRLSTVLPAEKQALPPNARYMLLWDYPTDHLHGEYIESGENGMTTTELLRKIQQAYIDACEDDELAGLWLGGIEIDHANKLISPSIGS